MVVHELRAESAERCDGKGLAFNGRDGDGITNLGLPVPRY